MKIWSTKHALTAGIEEYEAEECGDGEVRVSGEYSYLHGEGEEWHRTKEEATARAEVMRNRKVDSLRRLLAKIEAMRFVD